MVERKNYVRTRTVDMWLGEDGIARIYALPNTRMTVEDDKANFELMKGVFEGKARPIYIDMRNVVASQRESRQFQASAEVAAMIKAIALIIDSYVTRMIGGFFIRITRPPYPVRMFQSEQPALEWLQQFVEKEP